MRLFSFRPVRSSEPKLVHSLALFQRNREVKGRGFKCVRPNHTHFETRRAESRRALQTHEEVVPRLCRIMRSKHDLPAPSFLARPAEKFADALEIFRVAPPRPHAKQCDVSGDGFTRDGEQ